MHELLSSTLTAQPAPIFFRNVDTFANVEETPQEIVPQVVLPDVEKITAEAKEAGLREGFMRSEQQVQLRIEQERQSVLKAVSEFVTEKQRYFSGLEKEVVRLALAIAERVLHREASMDPLLLAGAARVALEELSDGTEATLRVAPSEEHDWKQTMCRDGAPLTVAADGSLQPGELLLETPAGTVELGVRAQLQEIERGFFELMGRKPVASV